MDCSKIILGLQKDKACIRLLILSHLLNFDAKFLKVKSLELKYWLGRCSLAFDQILLKKRPRKLWFVLILNKIKCEQGRRLLVFLTKIEQYTREIFKVNILTQGTWTLVKLCRRNFCNAIKSEYSPNNFTNPKLKNVHFWKDFSYNISPIIGSSNHKGIVFLFLFL